MSDRILTLNAGLSSLKFALFDVAATGDMTSAFKGKVELGNAGTVQAVVDASGTIVGDLRWPRTARIDQEELFAGLIGWAEKRGKEVQS